MAFACSCFYLYAHVLCLGLKKPTRCAYSNANGRIYRNILKLCKCQWVEGHRHLRDGKISCQSHYYCRRYGHLKIWLKTPIPAPEIYVLGVLPPKHYFSSSRPRKGTSLAETASYEPLSIAIGRGVSSGWRDKDTKKTKKQRVAQMRWQTGYRPRPHS